MSKPTKKVYEVGIHIVPRGDEEGAQKVYEQIQEHIATEGGTVLAAEKPQSMELAYPIRHTERREDSSHARYSKAFFCSVKFEATQEAAVRIRAHLTAQQDVLRFLLLETIRESTRVDVKALEEESEKKTAVDATAQGVETTTEGEV